RGIDRVYTRHENTALLTARSWCHLLVECHPNDVLSGLTDTDQAPHAVHEIVSDEGAEQVITGIIKGAPRCMVENHIERGVGSKRIARTCRLRKVIAADLGGTVGIRLLLPDLAMKRDDLFVSSSGMQHSHPDR